MTYKKHPQRGKATKEAIDTIPEYECEPDISQCPSCLCMTKTIKGYCGKCNFKKDAIAKSQILKDPECPNCNHWLGREYQYCPSCGGYIIWDREHTKVLEVNE